MTADAEDLSQPAPILASRLRAAALRSKLMLEIAAELVGRPEWTFRQARIQLREQGGEDWPFTLFASDSLESIREVASGVVQFGIVNPAVAAALAVRGTPPFEAAVPIRAIACEPSFDQLGLAVRSGLGIRSLAELVDRRVPIVLSLRAQRDHSVHVFVRHVLEAAGATLVDIEAWGGRVRFDDGLPHHDRRRLLMERGAIDALFDEGVDNWVDQAVQTGFVMLEIDEPILARLEAMGHRRAVLSQARFPNLPADVRTIDFSGFLVYTHAAVPDTVVEAFCCALDARRDRIPWQGGASLPIERMVAGAIDAPIPIPLHPAAERYWADRANAVGSTRHRDPF